MIILGIDSSSKSASAAVLKDGVLIAENFENSGYTHSQTLLPLIKKTLLEADVITRSVKNGIDCLGFSCHSKEKSTGIQGIPSIFDEVMARKDKQDIPLFSRSRNTVRDIDLIAVTRGPGSFTGLRIGMATAKGLAATYDIKCVGVSTLAALAVPFKNQTVCSVMDARCGQVYCGIYRNGEVLLDDCAMTAIELSEIIKNYENVILTGDGAKMQSDVLGLPVAPDEHLLLRGSSVAKLGLLNIDDASDAADLTPVYLRLPQAERELRGIRSAECGIRND